MSETWVGTGARWCLYGLLGAWYGASILQQMDKKTAALRRVDPTGIVVPNWRFFAPTPARHDYNVLYRDKLGDGKLTRWQEKELTLERNVRQMIWHPHRRMEKALFDVASELFQLSEVMKQPEQIQFTVPYLSLLNFVTHQVPHDLSATHVQFLIANSAAHEETVEPRMLFLSELHALA